MRLISQLLDLMITVKNYLIALNFPLYAKTVLPVNTNFMPTTTAQPQRVNPRPSLSVESKIPLSFTYQNKQLAFYNKLKSRIRALKYHFDRIDLPNDALYLSTQSVLCLLSLRLVNTNFICNDTYNYTSQVFRDWFPSTNDDHITELFGRVLKRKPRVQYALEDAEREYKYAIKCNKNVQLYKDKLEIAKSRMKLYKNFMDRIRKENLAQRRSVLKKRLRYSIAQAAHDGWFLVFNTLTAKPECIKEVFSDHSTEWSDYVRSIDRSVGIRSYGSWSAACQARKDGNDFHKYFAVVEYGTKGGNPHIHVIHMMKCLPVDCKDPNIGLEIPYRTEIHEMKYAFWTKGFSTPIAMRFSNSDAFSKLGWRWPSPINKETGKPAPVPLGSAQRVANYVAKYVNKSYNETNQKGEIKWRTKMTRNLGMEVLEKMTNKLNRGQLLKITVNPPILQILNQRIPTSMIRKMAFKKWMFQKSSMKSTIRKMSVMSKLRRRESILKSLNVLTEKTLESNPENSGDTKTPKLLTMDTFSLHCQCLLNEISIELFGSNPLETPPSGLGGYCGDRYYG